MGNHLQDESHKTPERGKQGGLVVPIHLPTEHSPRHERGFSVLIHLRASNLPDDIYPSCMYKFRKRLAFAAQAMLTGVMMLGFLSLFFECYRGSRYPFREVPEYCSE